MFGRNGKRKMSKSLVSVIVPVYNGEKTIESCLKSLLSQSLKDIEIICVNDGSTDGTREILEKYSKKYNYVKNIECENSGRSAARNIGIKNCKTKYVMFCDDDDSYRRDMCKKMVSAMEENAVDIGICGVNIQYNTHKEMKESDDEYYGIGFEGKQKINDNVILNTDVSVWNKIFRMDIINQNEISFPDGLNNEDFYFYNAYMSVSDSAYYLNEKLYNYVRQKGSIMSNIYTGKESSWDHLTVAERLFDYYKKTGFLSEHTDLFWEQWVLSYWFSYDYLTNDEDKARMGKQAVRFICKNYKKWQPKRESVRLNVEDILKKNGYKSLWERVCEGSTRFYERINIGYKQTNRINQQIDELIANNHKMIEKIDNIGGVKNGKQRN